MLRQRFLHSLLLLHVLSFSAYAEKSTLTLASVFSDHMVLQRDAKVPVWGRAEPGVKVVVELAGQTHEATADAAGKWRVDLDKLPASEQPRALTVRAGSESVAFKDVLVGDVWLASGQSNMEMWVGLAKDAEQEIANAKWPLIRTLIVPNTAADQPADTFPAAAWEPVSPETISKFSAVAYFFGRDLHQHLHVPIGLIASDVGATGMENWTSRAALEASPTFKKATLESFSNPLKEKDQNEYKRTQYFMHSRLFNAMIHPVIPFGIRGVIWYQGESNSGRPQEYAELTRVMLTDWRQRWGQGDFPFLFVQLPGWVGGYENWRPFREAQQDCLSIPNTGMAVAIDAGEEKEIHPKDKQTVGKRLALVARRLVYGENIVDSGPVFKDMKIADGKVRLSFDHIGGGLKATGELKGFEIAGVDGKYVPATATIAGDDVILSNGSMREPKSARYDWTDYPEGNLVNADGLPAWPFRTPRESGGAQ